jgi:CheY-like chemotaxis protein
MQVLLVEDNPTVRQALAVTLGRAGHFVFAVESVAEAHEVATAQWLDLIISDIHLPDGNGMELMRWLTERGSLPGIAISGDADPRIGEMCLQSGFTIFLPKPVLASALEGAISRLVSDRNGKPRKSEGRLTC